MNISQINCQQNVKNSYYATFQANSAVMTQSTLMDAIKNAKDIDSLRALNSKLKNMPSEVKDLYFKKSIELRNKLTPAQKGINNCLRDLFRYDVHTGNYVFIPKERRDKERSAENSAEWDRIFKEKERQHEEWMEEHLRTHEYTGYADR